MPFEPQWRFGFGLSYTQFRYSNLRITPKTGDSGFVTVSADVQNVGSRDGDEVCQLYLTDTVSSVLTPVIELQGVQRITVKAGERKTVTFHLTPYQLSLLDADMARRVEPGEFRIHVGGVSPDVPAGVVDDRKRNVGFTNPLHGVSGSFIEPKAYAARFTYALSAPSVAQSRRSIPVTVMVRNEGNLTDVTEARLYDGSQIGSWSFEVRPGERRAHTFQVKVTHSGQLALVAGTQLMTRPIHLERN
jgi:beta-glucosidase